jgi:hypothetical protein
MGPNPGSIPIMVPITHPNITIKRLVKDKAVFRPNKIPSIIL